MAQRPVALVTGASSGIGFEIAKHLKRHGFNVYAGARRVAKMNALDDIGIHTMYLDVTDSDSITAAVSQIDVDEGRLDVLVNNAGYGLFGALEEVPLEKAKAQFDVNVFGLSEMTKQVLPLMRRQRAGRVINVSSVAGKTAAPLGNWYGASKYAVEGLSDNLRLELANFGIDVVVIEPGATTSAWAATAGDQLASVAQNGPYTKLSAEAAAFLKTIAAFGSDPALISRAVVQAATARRPKTRYVPGAAAKAEVFGRWLLSDRMMDSAIRQLGKQSLRYQTSRKESKATQQDN